MSHFEEKDWIDLLEQQVEREAAGMSHGDLFELVVEASKVIASFLNVEPVVARVPLGVLFTFSSPDHGGPQYLFAKEDGVWKLYYGFSL